MESVSEISGLIVVAIQIKLYEQNLHELPYKLLVTGYCTVPGNGKFLVQEAREETLYTVVIKQNTSVPLSFFRWDFVQRAVHSPPCKRQLSQLKAQRE